MSINENHNLTEQEIFEKVKVHPKPDVRIAAIEQLTDEKLIYAFKDDQSARVRESVVNKLSDEKINF